MVQQIEIEGYTRTGFRVVVRDTAKDGESAKKFIESVGFMGLLPSRPEKPDEIKYGRISHVALTHTDNGTPHIAFFHENEKLENRWTHKYLNSQADRDEFEAWSGLKLANMAAMEGNVHPQRGKAAQAKFLIALPSVRALNRITTYSKVTENGQEIWQPENDVDAYIMPKVESPNPAPKADEKGDWWDTKELDRVQLWINQAMISKPEFIEKACKIVVMHDFKTPEDYIAALKQVAANEEQKAKGEDIPF